MDNKIVWNKDFNVNVIEIDKQHYELFCKLEELDNFDETDNDEVSLHQLNHILYKVKNICETCFKTEEFYFNKFGYSHIADHLFEHREILKTIDDFFKVDSVSNPEGNFSSVVSFSKKMKDHILKTDLEFGKFIKNNSRSYFLKAFG
jgi:hemerythrin-like metal-binding protein